MANFNKVRVKKLYMPSAHGTRKGHGNKPTLVTATADELNIMDGVTATAAELNILDGVTATYDELNILEGVTATAAEINSLDFALQTAAHGAGAIGTAFAPRTYRYTKPDGTIITEIHVDLTGLKAKGDAADDVIGLGVGGAAYIGRYVTATYGIVYRMERICVELPAGTNITTDIDIALNVSALLAYDGTTGASEFDQGPVTAGSIQTLETCGFTANDYIYITEGDATATAGTYTAGQFIIRFYGHALIT
jgi:hypothetical protein